MLCASCRGLVRGNRCVELGVANAELGELFSLVGWGGGEPCTGGGVSILAGDIDESEQSCDPSFESSLKSTSCF